MDDFNITCIPVEEQEGNKTIKIVIDNKEWNNMMYKILVSKNGVWNTVKEFGKDNYVVWSPEESGAYNINVQVKKENSNRVFDYTQTIKYIVGEKSEKIIKEIVLNKREYTVGEKVEVEVISSDLGLLYRYRVRNNNNWIVLKDYSSESTLKFTLNKSGKTDILVECKEISSDNNYDDSYIKSIDVWGRKKPEISKITCLSNEILEGKEVKFKVQTINGSESTLYKFIKIGSQNKIETIQDYSSIDEVSFIEEEEKEAKILCMVKDMYSINEYDDRAVLNYEVKAYETVKINNFITDLPSFQPIGTTIKLSVDATGGKKLLYRFMVLKTSEIRNRHIRKNKVSKVKSNILLEEVQLNKIKMKEIENQHEVKVLDTEYQSENNINWTAHNSGIYKLVAMAKDISSKECESIEEIEIVIEETGIDPIKIKDIKVEGSTEWMLVDDKLKISVEAEGGIEPSFEFKVMKDGEIVKKIEYGSANWVNFIPKEKGEFLIEISIRDKYSQKDYDCHELIPVRVHDYLPAKIDYILYRDKGKFVVGDSVTFKIICQNIEKSLYKYKLKIDNRIVEESEYCDGYTLQLDPKTHGEYKILFYIKNKLSQEEYDDIREITFLVEETPPIVNTKLVVDDIDPQIGKNLTFNAQYEGGKSVVFQFYLRENNQWILVQPYSKKDFYTFMPFYNGEYKVLVMAKSMYTEKPYEDFDIYTFYLK